MSFEKMAIATFEAEVALRKSIFLKGYELGKGRPLTNEEQKDVVDTHYQQRTTIAWRGYGKKELTCCKASKSSKMVYGNRREFLFWR